jgi:leucyl aminopeptidase
MMTQDWNSLELKLGLKSDLTYHLAVTSYGSRMVLMDLLKNRATAKDALSSELKKIKKDEESPEAKTIRVSFEGKGGLTALVLQGDSKAYASQVALRKAFLNELKVDEEGREIQVSLRGLTDDDAVSYLNWIASLAVISRYRSPVFGKKAKDQKPLGKLVIHFDTGVSKKAAESALHEGMTLGFANNQVRHLAELPSNILHPGTYRERAEQLAKDCGQGSLAGAIGGVVPRECLDSAGGHHSHHGGCGGTVHGWPHRRFATEQRANPGEQRTRK